MNAKYLVLFINKELKKYRIKNKNIQKNIEI